MHGRIAYSLALEHGSLEHERTKNLENDQEKTEVKDALRQKNELKVAETESFISVFRNTMARYI